MPLELFPGSIKVTTPEQAKPLPYSRTEVIGAGISAGLKETTYSYLSDTNDFYTAKNNVDDQDLTEGEFRNMPGVTPDMAYFPGMTMGVANTFIDSHEQRANFQRMRENTDFQTTGYYMLGGFMGNATDIVNWVPFGMPIKGAGALSNAARMGGANALIETALTPLVATAYTGRGEELTPEDAATNLAFAAGAGALLSLGFSGIGKTINSLDAFSLMGRRADPGGMGSIITKAQKGDYVISEKFGELLNRDQIGFADATGTSIKNTDPFVRNTKRFIDTAGQIHDDVNNVRTNEHVTVDFNEITNIKTISGTNESILKILSTIERHIGEDESIRIIRTDKPGRGSDIAKKDLNKWLNDETMTVNTGLVSRLAGDSQLGTLVADIKKMFKKPFEAELDDNVAVVLGSDFRYEGEFELKGPITGFDPANGIGRIYEVDPKTGTRKLLSSDEAKQVFDVLGENINSKIEASGADLVRKSKISGRTIEESILNDNPGAKKNMDDALEAVDNNVKKEKFEDNLSKTEEELKKERETDPEAPIIKTTDRKTTFESAIARSLMPTNFFEKYGIVFNEKENIMIITNQTKWNALTDAERKFATTLMNVVNNTVDQSETIKTLNKGLNTRGDCR